MNTIVKTIIWVVSFSFLEAICLYPLVNGVESLHWGYAIFAFVVAVLICSTAYAGSLIGIGQLFIIPYFDSNEIKKDLIKAWSFAIATVIGFCFVQLKIYKLLYSPEGVLDPEKMSALIYNLPKFLLLAVFLGVIYLGYHMAKGQGKYTNEDKHKSEFRKKGINDGRDNVTIHKCPNTQKQYTDFIAQTMDNFVIEIKRIWNTEKYNKKLQDINKEIDIKNQSGKEILSKINKVVNEKNAIVSKYKNDEGRVTAYTNEKNNAIKLNNGYINELNNQGILLENRANELKKEYSDQILALLKSYATRLAIYWEYLSKHHKDREKLDPSLQSEYLIKMFDISMNIDQDYPTHKFMITSEYIENLS